MTHDDHLYADIEPPVGVIGSSEQVQWASLPEKAREYALASLRAAWACGPLLASQVPGATEVINFIVALYSHAAPSGRPELLARLHEYCAAVCNNFGPYRGFGDTIIVPRLTFAQISDIVSETAAERTDAEAATLFATLDAAKPWLAGEATEELGFWPEHCNAYYSQDMTEADVKAVDALLAVHDVCLTHTSLSCDHAAMRVFVDQYSVIGGTTHTPDLEKREYGKVTLHDGKEYIVERRRGKEADNVRRLLRFVETAAGSATSVIHHEALKHIARYLLTGSNSDWRMAQEAWVAERLPGVEYVLGRVETYRDPAGARAEWEGCVFLVDRETSSTLTQLVGARASMPFPWPSHYREVTAEAPPYMSVNVIAQVSSGAFIGLNLPNEVDIRSQSGSLNFSMANLLEFRAAGDDREPVSFIQDQDQADYKKLIGVVLNSHVALHEGLGHAVGRLFTDDCDESRAAWLGKASAIDGHALTSDDIFYKTSTPNYSAHFGALSSAMEEARAETAALHLAGTPEVMEAFHIDEKDRAAFVRVGILSMLRSALTGLENYDPVRHVWRQAHSMARWSILAACMKGAPDDVKLLLIDGSYYKNAADGAREETFGPRSELSLRNAENLIPVIADHLNMINHCRTTGNVAMAKKYFDSLCILDDEMTSLRAEVLARRQARMLYAYPTIDRVEDEIVLQVPRGETPLEKVIYGFVDNYNAIQ